jgi:hypothetical protein
MTIIVSWNYEYYDFMKRPARSQAASNDTEELLQVTIPRITKRSLKMRAAETGEPMRVLVLKALASAGITVPQGELHDRRKET